MLLLLLLLVMMMMAVLLLVVMLARMLTLVSSPQDASEGRKKTNKKNVSRAWKVALTRRGEVAGVEKVGILSQTVNLDSSLRLLHLKKKKRNTEKRERSKLTTEPLCRRIVIGR